MKTYMLLIILSTFTAVGCRTAPISHAPIGVFAGDVFDNGNHAFSQPAERWLYVYNEAMRNRAAEEIQEMDLNYRKMGIAVEQLGNIIKVARENGLTDAQLEPILAEYFWKHPDVREYVQRKAYYALVPAGTTYGVQRGNVGTGSSSPTRRQVQTAPTGQNIRPVQTAPKTGPLYRERPTAPSSGQNTRPRMTSEVAPSYRTLSDGTLGPFGTLVSGIGSFLFPHFNGVEVREVSTSAPLASVTARAGVSGGRGGPNLPRFLDSAVEFARKEDPYFDRRRIGEVVGSTYAAQVSVVGGARMQSGLRSSSSYLGR